MTKTRIVGLLAGAALLTAPLVAWAGGSFQTLPVIGSPAYCASTVTGTGGLSGTTGTGQGTTGAICGQTVPAGPAVFSGQEVAPFDLYAPGTTNSNGGAQTAVARIEALGGAGPMIDNTAPATATIPANTPYYFIDGTQASAFTITLPAIAAATTSAPASPAEGDVQRVSCAAATAGALTIAANTGQSLKPAFTAAACVAGTTYAYRYQASSTTWFRIQ